MSTTISVDLSVSTYVPSGAEVRPTPAPIINFKSSLTPYLFDKSENQECEARQEGRDSRVLCSTSANATLQSSDVVQEMQTADTVAADSPLVSKDLSPTAPIFVPARQDSIPTAPSVIHKNLSARAPIFIPDGQISSLAAPSVISKGLSATAPVFIPNGQNTVPFSLSVAGADRSLRRDICLDQILEQYDLARQVEMDARRQYLDYGLGWIQTSGGVIKFVLS
ncbi:hypothetical protein BKA64DRAFT_767295 [Cadophora sp. MPI-SDFR-AT-0126]|nr:hypothetical protein BKA64DRAFT_767295 [Leotiomycetes sp. MPI-SDFR-AT-0126]